MKNRKEINQILKSIEFELIEGDSGVSIYDYMNVRMYTLEQNELRGARKIIKWLLEPKPKKQKIDKSHKLKEYGLPENAGIKRD